MSTIICLLLVWGFKWEWTVSYISDHVSYFKLICLNSIWYQYLNCFSLPWNQTTLMGYSGEICVIISAGFASFAISGALLILFVSVSLHHQAFYKIFKYKLDAVDRCEENQCDEMFLRDLIRFHISAKEWVLQTHTFNYLTRYRRFYFRTVGFWSRLRFMVRLLWSK